MKYTVRLAIHIIITGTMVNTTGTITDTTVVTPSQANVMSRQLELMSQLKALVRALFPFQVTSRMNRGVFEILFPRMSDTFVLALAFWISVPVPWTRQQSSSTWGIAALPSTICLILGTWKRMRNNYYCSALGINFRLGSQLSFKPHSFDLVMM